MSKYVKGALKILANYCICLIIFGVFLSAILGLAKDNLGPWLAVYSFAVFLLMFSIIYTDMKQLAVKEKRPQYNLKPYPIKGLVLGTLGFLPFILMQFIYPFINFNQQTADRLKELVLKTMLAPMYFILRLGGNSIAAYIIASLAVPIIAMLGYMAGYYGFELMAGLRKKPASNNTNTQIRKK